jgi:hypothetical protein
MMHVLLLTATLTIPTTGDACALPANAQVSKLRNDAEASFRAGDTARAADLYQQALQLYPPCGSVFTIRKNLVIRALNALAGTPAPPGPLSCASPVLQTARLVRRFHAELMDLPDNTRGLRKARADFSDRLGQLSQPAREAATFLDATDVPIDTLFEDHARATSAFGACPELRSALSRHVFAALPPGLPPPPACDAPSEQARQLLRQALTALERVEPETATSTKEYAALSYRLATLTGIGPTLSTTRTQATTWANLDLVAEAWAALARKLPTCSVYLADKHDAALAAVAAWQRKGEHKATSAARVSLSLELLDAVITGIEADYGAQAAALREHQSLTRSRTKLARPPMAREKQLSAEVPAQAPSARARPEPEKWISRHRPERNLIELGVMGGVMAPASGLLDDEAGSHQLFNAYKLRDSPTTDPPFYKPYRKVAPEIGLRVSWYPLSFLGGEIEGGVMPTRVVENGTPGARATLFNFRAHLIAQIPFWRVTPFLLIGGGMLGTTGALGKDVDPSLNLGAGVKIFLSPRLMLRLDLRDSVAARKGIDAGGTHYPEILLGLSLTLNRRQGRRASAQTIPAGPSTLQGTQGK